MAKHYAPQQQTSRAPAILAVVIVLLLVGGGFALWWFVLRPQPVTQSEQTQQAQQTSETKQDDASSNETAKTSSTSDTNVSKMEPNARFKAMLSAGEVNSIRLIGDSITAGYGTDGFTSLFDTDTGVVIYDDGSEQYYEPTTQADDWANAFRAYATSHGVKNFVNAGIGGWFMHDLAEHPDAWIGEGADVIFVALGTNDAGYYGLDEYSEDASKALAAVAKKCKHVVVVTPVSDRRDVSMLVEPASELGDVLRPLCEENGYAFVDARSVSTAEQFCDDDLHPNSVGSLDIWKCVQQSLDLA